jgi:FAD/FMN-containing dehydrogenase
MIQEVGKAETKAILDEQAVQRFAAALDGVLRRPGDPGYEEARRVWNGMIDKRPALIAACAHTEDVATAVTFAREQALPLSVRGGGHNVAGHAANDGGLVIDLSPMRQVRVDAATRTVRAGGGATIADLDQATQAHGLAVPMGVVSQTGIAGLTLGGGVGWLRNKYGLSCDNLLAAEVVTADGRVRRADDEENADLLWGLRGGGGNFGVVTQFTYRAHPVGPEVMFVFTFYHGDAIGEALPYYRDYCETAPREVSSFAICGDVPPEADFPEAIHGEPYVLFAACYAGPVEAGRRVLQPLRRFAEPLVDFSDAMPYLDVQKILDADYPDGMRYYWKSLYLDSLDEEAIAAVIAHNEARPGALSTIDIWPMGGAVRDVDEAAGAFGGREAPYLLGVEANWEDPAADEANVAWARRVVADMQRFSGGAEYLNFPGFQEGGEKTMRATFGAKYRRLAALKQKYDPTNLFRRNQNIKPAENPVER